MVYSGKCKGGPWDGQMFAHESRTKDFFSPMIAGLALNDDAPIIPVKIGEYYFAAHNYWQWLATKEGKALATLSAIGNKV